MNKYSNEVVVGDERSILRRREFIRRTLAIPAAATATAFATPASALIGTDGYYFNVKDYGAVGNGIVDDTASIQSAINAALAAGGGVVLLPSGRYLVGGGLLIDDGPTTKSIVLQGVNPGPLFNGPTWAGGTTIVVPASFSGNTISFGNSTRGTIRNLSIYSDAPRTAGRAIYLYYTIDALIEDVDMNNQYIGIEIFGGYGHRINRGAWNIAPNGTGVWVNGNQSGNNGLDSSNDTYINLISSNGGFAAFRIQNTGGVWMSQCDSITARYGLLIDPGNDQAVTWCTFDTCAFDSSYDQNLRIQASGNGKVWGLTFIGCWTATLLASAGYTNCVTIGAGVDGVQFVGHRFFNSPGAHGLWVYQAKNIYLDGCVASGFPNGGGFVFLSTVGFAVRNCHSGTYSGQVASKYGIYVDSACSKYLISGCTLLGNTNNLVDGGASPKAVPAGGNLLA